MNILTKVTIGALALFGAAIAGGTPAQAQGFTIGVGPGGGINFSYSSGGYCDRFGCPYGYWDMPIYYCPVYYRGHWYRGPVYYRHRHGRTQYWLRGGWRYDHWRGPRPEWACNDRFGPALGFGYYDRDPRFRIRKAWRSRYHRNHPHYRSDHDRGPGHHRSGPGDRRDRHGHNSQAGERRDRVGHGSASGVGSGGKHATPGKQDGKQAKPGNQGGKQAKPGKQGGKNAKPGKKGGDKKGKPQKGKQGKGSKDKDKHSHKH